MLKIPKLLTILSAPLIALALASCGGGSDSARLSQPGEPAPLAEPSQPVDTGFAFDAPADMLKAASSEEGGRLFRGSEFDSALSSPRVTVVGQTARIAPNYIAPDDLTFDDLAFAIYRFSVPGLTLDPVVDWGWQAELQGPERLFIGLGNLDTNSWDWFGDFSTEELTVTSMDPYLSESDELILAVVLTGDVPGVLSWIKIGGNAAPIVDLVVTRVAGEPGTFEFDASGSTDLDGTIVQYEWDFDGDATYDMTGTEAVIEHTYPGAVPATTGVRVTDDDGDSATSFIAISAYDEVEDNDDITQANALPAFPVEGFFGNAGTGGYDGDKNDFYSFEVDSPGFITFFMYHIDDEADLDMRLLEDNGDGTTTILKSSTTTSDNEILEYEFTEAGTFYWEVYVYVNAPEEAVADYSLATRNGRSDKPVADIVADVTEGDAPLSVNFDASGSTDTENAIVLYEFDFEGDGIYDTSSPTVATASHTYSAGGVNSTATVRVTDDFGWTDTDTVTISAYGPPPVASFTATPENGPRVHEVSFDASAVGTVSKYEWDFDGDGRIDLTKTSGADVALATARYFTVGDYLVKLIVTDNQGQTDEATKLIMVSGGLDDETEPNNDDSTDNTAADAAAANVLPPFSFFDYYGHVGPDELPAGDPDDWYKFTMTETGLVDFYLEFFDAVCDIDMKLYAEGDYENDIATSTGTDDDEAISLELTAGTYYLRIYAFTDAPAAGGYRLSGLLALP